MYIIMPTFSMSKYLTITEARQQLLELPAELENEPVIITKHGKPVMTAMSYEQFESLLETIEILSDHEFLNRLSESIAQSEKGEMIDWETAKSTLDL
jgi:antitoxin YefM